MLFGMVGFCMSLWALGKNVSPIIISVCILLEMLYCLVRVRRNRLLLVVYGVIAYSCYSICSANYLNHIDGTMYTAVSNTVEAQFALALLQLFISILILLLPKEVKPFGYGIQLPTVLQCNTVLISVLAIVLSLICIYGFGRPDTLGGDRGSPSAIYEYSTILFIAAFYFAGENRIARRILLVILIIYAFQNLAFGGRVTAVQLILIAFFFLFNRKVSTTMFVVMAGIFFVGMIGYGAVRTAVWDTGIKGLVEGFLSYCSNGLAWDTAYSSWYTSITFVRFDDLITDAQHAYYFKQWLLSIFLGGSSIPDSSLAALTKPYFFHYDGGILPIYLWFHFGIAGVIIAAVLVSIFASWTNRVEKLNTRENQSKNIVKEALPLILTYFVITSPRWFLYSPSQITRGVLLCFLACVVLLFINSSMRKRQVPIVIAN